MFSPSSTRSPARYRKTKSTDQRLTHVTTEEAAAECVSEEALIHLKTYKYSSVDKSFTSRYILKHYVRQCQFRVSMAQLDMPPSNQGPGSGTLS